MNNNQNSFKYTCKQCGNIDFAKSFLQISQRKKICTVCMKKNNLEKRKKYLDLHKDKTIPNSVVKFCLYCKKEFNSFGALYCSSQCRKKGVEKKKFYKNLDEANQEINIIKTRVFGQGAYEKVNFIKDILKKK